MIEIDLQSFQELQEPLDYTNADIYFERFESWIRKMQTAYYGRI